MFPTSFTDAGLAIGVSCVIITNLIKIQFVLNQSYPLGAAVNGEEVNWRNQIHHLSS